MLLLAGADKVIGVGAAAAVFIAGHAGYTLFENIGTLPALQALYLPDCLLTCIVNILTLREAVAAFSTLYCMKHQNALKRKL